MIYLIFLFISLPVFAGNYVPASKAPTQTYWEKAACETSEGSECIDVTGCPLDECDIKTVGGKKQLARDAAKLAKKLKDKDDAEKALLKKIKDRSDRKVRLESQCANAEGLVKELCDHALDK